MSAPFLKNPRWFAIICFALATVTLAVYWPVTRHGFIYFDDPPYITDNPTVQSGLTWHGLVWAFQIGYAAYWQPLTWISHMMDCQLFGLNPAGHHFVNILFHIANVLLLFLLLNRLTGSMWRSAFVAAFFAWHPLRVESVAWAAERKDVLSGFFWMLTLLAYARAMTGEKCLVTKNGDAPAPVVPPVTRHRSLFYFLALLFFACALMSKPIVVTLPFVLLLLDFWPLNRFASPLPARKAVNLFIEKLPFFALAVADSLVMVMAQKENPSVWSLTELPMNFRIENALVSYLRYVAKTIWPVDLALIYPYPHHWPVVVVLMSAALLAAWTAFSLWRIKKSPYLAVGWFWFLGMLVPVIGITQVGMQSMADRFTYLPGIGLLIVLVWGADELFKRPEQKKFLAVAGAVALTGCLGVTAIQINYWQNDLKLFAHAVEVTTDNYPAEVCLGEALQRAGRRDEAFALYADAVRLQPDYPLAQFDLAMSLLERGNSLEASNHLAIAAQLSPHDAVLQYDFGLLLAQRGNPGEAAAFFRAALAAKPDFADARRQLNQVLNGTNSPSSPANGSTR
jgi:tetratricopeptide (TPR) repeat protein